MAVRDGQSAGKVSLRLILSDPAVRVVLLMIFVIMLGFGIVAPILPLYARSFGGIVAHAFGLASPLFIYSGLCLASGMLYLRFMPQAPSSAEAGSGEAV